MTTENIKKQKPLSPLFYQEERLAIVIDGPSIYAMTKIIDKIPDYKTMIEYFQEQSRLIRAHYYAAVFEDEGGFVNVRKLLDYLDYNGWAVTAKSAREYSNGGDQIKRKCNLGIDIAVDILRHAENYDHILLFTGDGDLLPAVKLAQERGVRFTICGLVSMVSDDLRRQADRFIDLSEVKFGNSFNPIKVE